MKRKIFFAAIGALMCAWASAQNTMVVNSEKIFKALPAYNTAVTQLDNMSKDYQKKVDDAFAAVQQMYNDYQGQRQYLSDYDRKSREDAIISREKEVTKAQQDFFGPDGELMKKRIEMIKPIQDKVFKFITDYAIASGFGIVIDQSANATLLYFAPTLDKTQDIINQLNK
ncbi:MAG: OmpH family outer membrane protein [Rikenellaceae bacterium]|jgi:outer membrane protein|nr:OmpH family outer membrane protein [Rikenellaceae bacterium]